MNASFQELSIGNQKFDNADDDDDDDDAAGVMIPKCRPCSSRHKKWHMVKYASDSRSVNLIMVIKVRQPDSRIYACDKSRWNHLTWVLMFYWVYLTNWGKEIKCEACRAFYLFFATCLINSIIHQHVRLLQSVISLPDARRHNDKWIFCIEDGLCLPHRLLDLLHFYEEAILDINLKENCSRITGGAP